MQQYFSLVILLGAVRVGCGLIKKGNALPWVGDKCTRFDRRFALNSTSAYYLGPHNVVQE
jgi:hypothetical protein